MTTAREIHLAARPQGWPTPADFRTVDTELADPGPGEVLVRNTFLSVDPYMRGRMNDVKSYVPPFALDAVMDGGAVGEVVASGSDGLAGRRHRAPPGRLAHPRAAVRRAPSARSTSRRCPPRRTSARSACPGMTAYVGLTRIAEVREGDTVFISGAAGAVGSVAGQIAKQLGAAKVIGSAGIGREVRLADRARLRRRAQLQGRPDRPAAARARAGGRLLRQRRRRPPRGRDLRDGRPRPDRGVRGDRRLQRRRARPRVRAT